MTVDKIKQHNTNLSALHEGIDHVSSGSINMSFVHFQASYWFRQSITWKLTDVFGSYSPQHNNGALKQFLTQLLFSVLNAGSTGSSFT